MAIFLCGFMGCGKTTIASTLSKYKGCSQCDTDELIVEKEGMSIPQIFEQKGESYFRQLESKIVESLENYKGIVACGGGLMLNDKNSEIARKNGVVIFLNTPFEICYERIAKDANRPIAVSKTKEELEELYNERFEKYKKNSDFTIDCDSSPMETAKLILKTISI